MRSKERALIEKRRRAAWKRKGLCALCGKFPWRNETSSRCKRCYETYGKNRRDLQRELKLEAFAAYGGPQCNCCGETTYEFLTFDHIDGLKPLHPTGKRPSNLPRWLKQNSYPEGIQILCYNCNCAKGFFGRCPHDST